MPTPSARQSLAAGRTREKDRDGETAGARSLLRTRWVVDAGYSSDQELDLALLFHFYRARFQIEFTFRNAKQHLGLHNGQARSQAKLDFHFNIVFAVLFWAPAGPAPGGRSPGALFLHQIKQGNFEADIHKRFADWAAQGRNTANSEVLRSRLPPQRLWLSPPPLERESAGP